MKKHLDVMKSIKNQDMMKKRVITVMAALLLLSAPVMSQVFVMDEDSDNPRVEGWQPVPGIPGMGSTNDQYTPVGSGALLLIGFGAAYAMAKRSRKK